MPVAIHTDREKAAKAMAPVAKDWMVWSPDNMKLIAPEIAQPRLRQPYAKQYDPKAIDELAELSAKIPDEIALQTVAHGRAEDCVERIEAFAKAGCRHFLMFFLPLDRGWTEVVTDFSQKVLPHFSASG
jgi:alkanesulfonate monooxygenase SsuD/methylene tetrahydromethanopterin reductase-like flavin-dependent oxidoreductase (luciferase family)